MELESVSLLAALVVLVVALLVVVVPFAFVAKCGSMASVGADPEVLDGVAVDAVG